MKIYMYSYYLSDFLHNGLIDAENGVDCITKLTKQIQHPELMRGLMIDLYSEPLAPLVARNNDLKAKIKEYEECIDHYETRNLELTAKVDELNAQLLSRLQQKELKSIIEYEDRILLLNVKIDELETELQQYKVYVSDITAAVKEKYRKVFGEDFCPNTGQPT